MTSQAVPRLARPQSGCGTAIAACGLSRERARTAGYLPLARRPGSSEGGARNRGLAACSKASGDPALESTRSAGGSPMCYVLLRCMSVTRTRYLFLAFLALALVLPAPADAARLTLTWTDNSINEQGFSIERRDEVGSYAVVATLGAGQSSYLDVTLPAAKTYCYRVRACNAAGPSPYTNEACGMSVKTAEDAIDLFVAGFYTEVLGRSPEADGLQAWASFLIGHCHAGGFQQLAASFYDSDEFRMSRPLALSELVGKLYVTYLTRQADPGGLAAWTNGLRQVRLAIALNGFVPSREFQSLLPDPTNRTAVTTLVTRFYNEVLGRAPDQAGLTSWVDGIVSTRSFTGLAIGFLASEEFEAKPQTFRDYITTLYRTFLGRSPDTAGLDGWETILRGALLQVINAGFVPSPEFQGLAASICR